MRHFSFFGILIGTQLLTACGNTNFNEILMSPTEKQSLTDLVTEGRYLYDKGKYEDALKLANKAVAINPTGEEALILKANIHLSMAGFDGFAIAKNLMDQSKSSSSGTNTKLAGSSSGDKTTDALSGLASAIGLETQDIVDLSNGTAEGLTPTVYIPKTRTEARESTNHIISNIRLAVSALCPLITSETARNVDLDPAHDCEVNTAPAKKSARSKFAWALAHLAEAVTFYSVVLYSDNGTPNLQQVSSKFKATDTDFITKLTSLTTVINNIFPSDPNDPDVAEDSMLNAMFSDLKITSYTFAAIGGVPSSVTDSIDNSITELESKVKTISGKTSTNEASTAETNSALKSALTIGVAKDLKTKIATITDATQKTQACTLFKQINADPSQLPTGC